jgi:UTP-glucose-1-phosphate uridylyltransferase
MTKEKAAELANMMDSLSNLYTLNELLEETIKNSDIVIKSSEEALSNLFNQKTALENKILSLEKQLNIRSDKESLLKEEVEQCSIVLLKANKQIKRQKTTMTITGTVAGISLIGIIISILVIAI